MVRKIIGFVSKYWLLLLILGLAGWLRMWHFADRYILGTESIRDFVVGYYGAEQWQAPLTGPFSSLGNFTFGPWYWYLLILAHLLIPSVYASWMLMSLLSVAQVGLMWVLGRQLQGNKLGLTMAFLAAISVHLVESQTSLSNPNPVNFIATLVLVLMLHTIKKNVSWKWAFGLGFWIGVGLFSHYQMIAYLLVVPVVWMARRFNKTVLVAMVGGLVVTGLPLLVFDLLNNWHTVRNIWFAYTDMGNRIYVPNSWTIYALQFLPAVWVSFWGLPKAAGLVFLAFSGVVSGVMLLKRKVSWRVGLVGLLFGIFIVQLRYYKGERFIGYVQYLLPFFVIYAALALVAVRRFVGGKLVFAGVMVGLVAMIAPKLQTVVADNKETVEFNQVAKGLEEINMGEKYQIWHCASHVEDKQTLAVWFGLERLGLLAEEGLILDVGQSGCLQRLRGVKYAPVELARVGVIQKESYPLNIIEATSSAYLEAMGYQRYETKSLYNKFARWWIKDKL